MLVLKHPHTCAKPFARDLKVAGTADTSDATDSTNFQWFPEEMLICSDQEPPRLADALKAICIRG